MGDINKISPTFCAAKWYQVTLDLENGMNHSCHHPERHPIELDEVQAAPSALHNTNFKKQQRKQMLHGIQVAECSYCWNIENLEQDMRSDRYIKSADDWAYRWPEVANRKWDDNFNPTYVEVMFDKVCNFSCMYCMADISSSVDQEMKKYGPIGGGDLVFRERRFPEEQKSDLLKKAFWKWLPDIYDGLFFLRVTGGEPLLSKDALKLFKYIESHENNNLTLAINSNWCVNQSLIDQTIEFIRRITGKVKKVQLYLSVDTYGEQAAYIRKGFDYNMFMQNVKNTLEQCENVQVVFMVTYNIFSIVGFDKLIQDVLELKKSYPETVLDISYLHNPRFLRVSLANSELKKMMSNSLLLLRKHMGDGEGKFSRYEVDKFHRIVSWVDTAKVDDIEKREFIAYTHEMDKRYNQSWKAIFPEMRSFYKELVKELL